MMLITQQENALMLEALDKGEIVLVKTFGKESRMRRSEKEAARMLIRTGEQVPQFIMRMVCTGLEYLYFCEDRQGEGIPVLLEKLAGFCGYKRIGTAILAAKQ